jgi:hypothetical protein
MNNMNILYGFFYNDCIYESADGLVSLHRTREGALKAMVWHKEEERKKYLSRHGKDEQFMKSCPFGFAASWSIHEIELKD